MKYFCRVPTGVHLKNRKKYLKKQSKNFIKNRIFQKKTDKFKLNTWHSVAFLKRIYLSDAAILHLPVKPFWVAKKFKRYSRRLVNCSIILTRTDPSSGNVSQHALTINFCELFHIKIFFDFFSLELEEMVQINSKLNQLHQCFSDLLRNR